MASAYKRFLNSTIDLCITFVRISKTQVVLTRPVGSKFEMVRPHYSAKRAHNVLGHTHLTPPPHPPPGIQPLQCHCSQIAFLAVLKPLSLSPNHSVAAVTHENEALLYAFFIVFAAVMARVFAIYCERSFLTLTLRRGLSSGDRVCFPPAPTEIL